MEKEFKFRLDDPEVFDIIVNDKEFNMIDLNAVEEIDMNASYFDTLEMDFRNRGIAYRIRHENERITATIKWDVNVKEGFHIREEFNLVVNDEHFAESPDIELFKSSDAYDVLYEAAGNKRLIKTIGMNYDRRQIKVDTGKSISCITLDVGTIHHLEGHAVPVCELEIEWYYGDEDDFKSLAKRIQTKYGLQTEDKSKLQRAFE
ncbi:MAG: CYTH domain-containing protein [Clostridiales bacterium]|nr:CYTH domain-containing protein [Clostridiales bacterium]